MNAGGEIHDGAGSSRGSAAAAGGGARDVPETRRSFLRRAGRVAFLGGLGLLWVALRRRLGPIGSAARCAAGDCGGCSERDSCADRMVWQIDPRLCVQCGLCATSCVLDLSAVKCVHAYRMCGHCKLCFGYFQPGAAALNSGAENQLCPTGAIGRRFIEEPYFEYRIDEALCIGCGKCVKGCTAFGNGSLFLQVRHDRCVNCNECAIARVCPSGAFVRVPSSNPYLLKDRLPAAETPA